jgi:predicted Kef-type K+ transport protein
VTTTDHILLGLVLALGCQLVASRTHLPAIVLRLPAGFIAGAPRTTTFTRTSCWANIQPIVSLGVGLILFAAGPGRRRDELTGGAHRVVARLIPIGIALTVIGVTRAMRA